MSLSFANRQPDRVVELVHMAWAKPPPSAPSSPHLQLAVLNWGSHHAEAKVVLELGVRNAVCDQDCIDVSTCPSKTLAAGSTNKKGAKKKHSNRRKGAFQSLLLCRPWCTSLYRFHLLGSRKHTVAANPDIIAKCSGTSPKSLTTGKPAQLLSFLIGAQAPRDHS